MSVHLCICSRRTTALRRSRTLWTGRAVRRRAWAALLLGRWSACGLNADVGVLSVTCAALQCVTELLCGYARNLHIGFAFPNADRANFPFGDVTTTAQERQEPAGIRFLPTPHAHAEPGAVLKAGARLFRSAAAFPPLRRCPAQQIFGLRKRSEEHTSELQSLMRTSDAVFCL